MKQTAAIFLFVLFTFVLSFAGYIIPLPVETRSVLVPVIVVFVPAIVCIVLALILEGRVGLHQLFSSANSSVRNRLRS